MPITSYTCTQPNIEGFLDHGQCTVSGGLRTCAIKEGARPVLLSSSASLSTLGFYGWDSNRPPYPNPFVVLAIPQGWCVGSVKMMFIAPSTIPPLSLSVHSAERLSTNTDRTMFSLVSEEVTRLAQLSLRQQLDQALTGAISTYIEVLPLHLKWLKRLSIHTVQRVERQSSLLTHPT